MQAGLLDRLKNQDSWPTGGQASRPVMSAGALACWEKLAAAAADGINGGVCGGSVGGGWSWRPEVGLKIGNGGDRRCRNSSPFSL